MRLPTVPLPVPAPGTRLTPTAFSELFKIIPSNCVLIGGQAVAWWAGRYDIRPPIGEDAEVTSKDIDLWGTLDNLFQIARELKTTPAIPNKYDRTHLVGAIGISVAGKQTALEVLQTVVGLDSNHRDVAMPITYEGNKLLVLSPVSLVITKLHALRQFDQKDRQDLLHVLVSLKASRSFISEAIRENPRFGLWNCNRLIASQKHRPNRKLEREHGFQILSAIPIESIESVSCEEAIPETERARLCSFLKNQWPRVLSQSGTGDIS